MNQIRIGIVGYGNLGKGTELAIGQNPDMKLVGVFTRRDPQQVQILTGDAQVFAMAAPPGVKVEVITVDDAARAWQDDQFGALSPVLVLFKSVQGAFESYEKGICFEKLQIGGIAGGPGRIAVEGTIALNDEDAQMLQSLAERGVAITFQLTTDTKIKEWRSIKDKYFPQI